MESNRMRLRNTLTGALIGIARAVDGNEHLICDSTDALVQEGLASLLDDFDEDSLTARIRRLQEEKRRLIPHCYECAAPCGKNNDYDVQRLAEADEEVRSLKLLLLSGIQGMAARARHAAAAGYRDREVDRFFYQVLFVIGEESFGVQELLPIAAKFGRIELRCAALLDR